MSKQRKELSIISEEYEKYLEMLSGNNAGMDDIVRYPLYFGCFKSALTGMFENIDRLKEKRNQYFEYENQKDKYVDFTDNANNIIAFCGGRGSGKTTALKEFQRILKNFGRKYEKKWWIEELSQLADIQEYEKKEIWFTVLDSIDASLLIDKEDIIELILAQMYDMVENIMHSMHYDNNKKLIADFVESFEKVYKSYHKLCKGENGELGDSAAVILKNMSSGPKIREAFSKLLDMFFKLMYSGQGAEQYLVVSIDDLDLNIKRGYEMLEQIHKYLSDYRVIVLTAVDFAQLSQVCELYFYKQYEVKHVVQGTIQKTTQDSLNSAAQNTNIEKLVRDYLLKALPLSNRIYMMDSRNFIGKAKVVQNTGEKEYVKDFIMKKLSRKLGIYYDIKDLGRHFSIPVSVRELVSYNDFLDSLYTLNPEIQTSGKPYMSLYDHNHARMNGDITERMASQELSRSSRRAFDSMVAVNILDRPKFTVDLCNEILSDPKQKVDNSIYQFGNLMEILYKLEVGGDKKFKNCISAFFTSEMTREYYSSIHNTTDKKRRSEYRLKRFVGATFGSEWLGQIIPIIPIKRDKGEKYNIRKYDYGKYHIGYIKAAQLDFYKIPIPIYEKEDSGIPLFTAVMQSVRKNRIAEILGCLVMLCTRFDDMDVSNYIPQIRCEVRTNKVEGKEKYNCSLSIKQTKGAIDFLGFMGKEWNDREIEQLTDNIVNGIQQGIREFQKNGENRVSAGVWKEEAGRKQIKDQLKTVLMRNFLTFPFYEVDLAYNVLKRARAACISEEGNFEDQSIYTAVQRGYGYIAAELYKEDLQYDGCKGRFYEKFVQSPFIRKFGIIYPDEISSKYSDIKSEHGNMPKMFENVLGGMVEAMTIPDVIAHDDTLE